MKRFVITLAAGAVPLMLAAPAHAGVGMCVEKFELPESKGDTDGHYWLRWGSGPGSAASRAVREDFKREKDPESDPLPACHYSPSDLTSGEFVVIEAVTRTYKNEERVTFALGFGGNRAAAIREAKLELARRNWSWQESKHGYSVIESGRF